MKENNYLKHHLSQLLVKSLYWRAEIRKSVASGHSLAMTIESGEPSEQDNIMETGEILCRWSVRIVLTEDIHIRCTRGFKLTPLCAMFCHTQSNKLCCNIRIFFKNMYNAERHTCNDLLKSYWRQDLSPQCRLTDYGCITSTQWHILFLSLRSLKVKCI